MRAGLLKCDRHDASFRLESNKRLSSGTQIPSQEQEHVSVTTSKFGLPIKGTPGTSCVRMIINRRIRPGVACWQLLRKRLAGVVALRVENRQTGIRRNSHRIKRRWRTVEHTIP